VVGGPALDRVEGIARLGDRDRFMHVDRLDPERLRRGVGDVHVLGDLQRE
jgi:hypothetical protein